MSNEEKAMSQRLSTHYSLLLTHCLSYSLLVNALQTALDAVIPTFILIALGGWIDKRFKGLSIETLSRLSIHLLVPALVFAALSETDLSLSSAALLTFAYLLYLLVLGLVSLIGVRGLQKDEARAVIVSTLFGNTGNMGLPITLFAYGQEGLERAVVLLVVSLASMFIAGPFMLAGGNVNLRQRAIETFKLPPVWATFAGTALNLLNISLPISLTRALDLLGDAAIPLMLVALGMQMARSWTWQVGQTAMRTTVLRLLVGPFIAYGIARLLGLSQLDTNVLLLSAALPVAVTMFVIAVEVKGDAAGVARSVVATTIWSLLAIMLTLFLFPSSIN
jgi:malate permease and related proteins